MNRGHVYDIAHGGRTRRVLVVSDDLVNQRLALATCVEVHEAGGTPPSILATELTAPVKGTVVVEAYTAFAARCFIRDLGAVTPRDMEAVETGMRVVPANRGGRRRTREERVAEDEGRLECGRRGPSRRGEAEGGEGRDGWRAVVTR